MSDLLTFMESLTTPDAEDWNLLVDHQRVWVTAVRNREGGSKFQSGEGTLRDLKKIIRNLPPSRRLGSITFILATDAETTGALDVLAFLQHFAKRKNFSLISIIANAPTKECWARGEKWALRHSTAAGRA